MKKDTFLSPKDVRLIDIVDKLPSFNRIALITSDNPLTTTKIYNVVLKHWRIELIDAN